MIVQFNTETGAIETLLHPEYDTKPFVVTIPAFRDLGEKTEVIDIEDAFRKLVWGAFGVKPDDIKWGDFGQY